MEGKIIVTELYWLPDLEILQSLPTLLHNIILLQTKWTFLMNFCHVLRLIEKNDKCVETIHSRLDFISIQGEGGGVNSKGVW